MCAKCPECNKVIIGEMKSFCKVCLYTFDTGGDKWYGFDDLEVEPKGLG